MVETGIRKAPTEADMISPVMVVRLAPTGEEKEAEPAVAAVKRKIDLLWTRREYQMGKQGSQR